MTGRRLYDQFCDAHVAEHGRQYYSVKEHTYVLRKPLAAWSYLSDAERRVWVDLAKRITPRKRKP